jgi:FdhD protein
MSLQQAARPGTTVRVRSRVFTTGADAAVRAREETLATEEPLEIRLGDTRFSVTMRTPGADFELAAGLLHGEGLLGSAEDLRAVRYCVDEALDELQRYNVVTVDFQPGAGPSEQTLAHLHRNVLTSSACGVCGKQSLEALRVRGVDPLPDGPQVAAEVLAGLPDVLRARQRLFERTGGLHAAGLFTPAGDVLVVREDVGRHNAVDKVVGWALMQGRLPLHDSLLCVSGRTSFEIVQKAVAAGIPVVAAVSAPSSLAVAMAQEFGLTLAGFVRDGRVTVYAGEGRVAAP